MVWLDLQINVWFIWPHTLVILWQNASSHAQTHVPITLTFPIITIVVVALIRQSVITLSIIMAFGTAISSLFRICLFFCLGVRLFVWLKLANEAHNFLASDNSVTNCKRIRHINECICLTGRYWLDLTIHTIHYRTPLLDRSSRQKEEERRKYHNFHLRVIAALVATVQLESDRSQPKPGVENIIENWE